MKTFLIFFLFSSLLWSQSYFRPRNIPGALDREPDLDDADRFLNLKKNDYAKVSIQKKQGWIFSKEKDRASLENLKALEILEKLALAKNISSLEKRNINIRRKLFQAKEIFLNIKQKSPQFFPGLFNLGKVHILLNEHKEAVAIFQKASEIIPQYWESYYLLGQALQRTGDIDKAVQNYRKAYRKNPFETSALIALGDLFIEKKRYTNAIKIFRYCLKIARGDNNAIIGLGKVAFYLEDYYDATLWFRKVDLKLDFNKNMHFFYAESAFFSRNYKAALEQYELILKSPDADIFSKVSYKWVEARRDQAKSFLLSEE